ncbi:MAG: hypothetical protein HY677_05520 [Chloroflexi bacterium]|nr:hypothetical protein [Chloroflexota bacterium]
MVEVHLKNGNVVRAKADRADVAKQAIAGGATPTEVLLLKRGETVVGLFRWDDVSGWCVFEDQPDFEDSSAY